MRNLFLRLSAMLMTMLAALAPVEARFFESKSPEYLVNAYNYFGWELLQQMAAAGPTQNAAISPYNMSEALTLLYHAAEGDTADELASALYGRDGVPDVIAIGGLRQTMLASGNATLRSASAILVNSTITIEPFYKQTLQDNVGTIVDALPFSSSASLLAINNWVAKQTGNKIPALLSRLPGQNVAVLINAVYFKANWEKPFLVEKTQPGTFTLASGQTRPHPFMRQTERFAYAELDRAQMVTLPYQGNRYSLSVILPQMGELPDSLLERLTLDDVLMWQQMSKPQRVALALPRLSLSLGVALDPYLRALGVNSAFDPARAQFRAFQSSAPVAVGGIVHRVAFDIDERGTEAAAATATALVTRVDPDVVVMTVNRPFIFVLQDNQTKQILFAGVVQNPA